MPNSGIVDRRPTGTRRTGEPSKGGINLRLETTCTKTGELQHGPVRYKPGSSCTGRCAAAEEAQHGGVRYSKAPQESTLDWKPCGPRPGNYILGATAPRSALQQSTPATRSARTSQGTTEHGRALRKWQHRLHARGATPTGRRASIHFIRRTRAQVPSSRGLSP
jgi:hypothetical protein